MSEDSEIEEGQIETQEEKGSIIIEQQQFQIRPQGQKSLYEFKSSNFKTKICEHFLKGTCKNGDKCAFIHPQDQARPKCKFFASGNCSKDKCEFQHDTYQCKFYFGTGNCNSIKCKFSHDPFPNENSKQQWIKDNVQFLQDQQKYAKVYQNQYIQNPNIQMNWIPQAPPSVQIQQNLVQINEKSPILSPIQDEDDENKDEKHSQITQDEALEIITSESEKDDEKIKDPRLRVKQTKFNQKNSAQTFKSHDQNFELKTSLTQKNLPPKKDPEDNWQENKLVTQQAIKKAQLTSKINMKQHLVIENQIKSNGTQQNQKYEKQNEFQNEWVSSDFNFSSRPNLPNYLINTYKNRNF